PDIPGTYIVTVQTGTRPMFDPIEAEESWAAYSVTDADSIETYSVSFTAQGIVGTDILPPLTAMPTIKSLDFLNLGLRYALPPIDVDALSALYEAQTGDVTDDFCMRVSFKKVAQAGETPDVWHYATCNEITAGQPTYMTVVGMQAETQYQLRHDYVRIPRPQPSDADYEWTLSSGGVFVDPDTDCVAIPGMVTGELITYTTGETPKEVLKHTPEVVLRPEYVENYNAPLSEDEGYVWWSMLLVGGGLTYGMPTATDLNGNLVYYMPYYKGAMFFGGGASGCTNRPSGRGTWFYNGAGYSTLNMGLSATVNSQVWAEVDLEGIPLWQISIHQINDMLHAGGHDVIAEVFGHHDAFRTPDGRTFVLGGG
ncbi:hypothetical protein KIPB_011636, partial [Kipferlia bialata]